MDLPAVFIMILLVLLALVILDVVYRSSKQTFSQGVNGSYARIVGGNNAQFLQYYRLQEKVICNEGNRGFYIFASSDDINAEEAAVRAALGNSKLPMATELEKGTWDGSINNMTWVSINGKKDFIYELIFSRLNPLTKVDIPELRQILTRIRKCVTVAKTEPEPVSEPIAKNEPRVESTMSVETTTVKVEQPSQPAPSQPAPIDDSDFIQDAAEMLGVTSSSSRSAQIEAVMNASNTGTSASNSPDAWRKTEKSTVEEIQHARKASPE